MCASFRAQGDERKQACWCRLEHFLDRGQKLPENKLEGLPKPCLPQMRPKGLRCIAWLSWVLSALPSIPSWPQECRGNVDIPPMHQRAVHQLLANPLLSAGPSQPLLPWKQRRLVSRGCRKTIPSRERPAGCLVTWAPVPAPPLVSVNLAKSFASLGQYFMKAG